MKVCKIVIFVVSICLSSQVFSHSRIDRLENEIFYNRPLAVFIFGSFAKDVHRLKLYGHKSFEKHLKYKLEKSPRKMVVFGFDLNKYMYSVRQLHPDRYYHFSKRMVTYEYWLGGVRPHSRHFKFIKKKRELHLYRRYSYPPAKDPDYVQPVVIQVFRKRIPNVDVCILIVLERLRDELKRSYGFPMTKWPIKVVAGYRDPKHKKGFKGCSDPHHTTGHALDIAVPGIHPYKLAMHLNN